MATIQTATVNLLETGTTTLTAGTAAAGYPLYRVHDRDLGRLFIGSAAATTTIHCDQGAGGTQALTMLFIASGHNLAGVTLDLQWSTDNVAWNDAVAQWPGAAGDIVKTFSALTKRYWRLVMTTPAAAPQIGEVILTDPTVWTRNPARPGGPQESIHNVTVAVTAEGRVRFEVNGPSLRQRNYLLRNISSTQRTQYEALWTAFAGSKPFLLYDHEGAWIFGRFTAQPQISEVAASVFSATMAFLEVPA